MTAPAHEVVTANEVKTNFGRVREIVTRGGELAVTFHSKPLAQIIPAARIEQERAELTRLQTEVAELRAQLAEATEAVSV